jgi:hypothetical protein
VSSHFGPTLTKNVGEDFRVTERGDAVVESDLSVIVTLVLRDGGKLHDALFVQSVGVSVRAAVTVFGSDGLLVAILLGEHHIPTGREMAN